MALSRQQIRERRRHLERQEEKNQSRKLTLQELNEAERLLEQKRSTDAQISLQVGSLCTAILSQIPEHREGSKDLHSKASLFISTLLDLRQQELTTAEPPPPEEDDEDDDDDEDPVAVSEIGRRRMTRAELFTVAAALPLGALALVPEKPEEKPAEQPGPMLGDVRVKWMVIHAGDGSTLPSHHPYGKNCGRCAGTGVPSPIWYTGK